MMARNREPIFKHYPVISLRVLFFEAFACANIAVAACIKICARASLAVSAAKSASSTCPFALSKLAFMFCKFEIELSKRLEIAPIFPRRVDIIDIGGYSSRPGADNIAEKIELDRVIPTLKDCKKANIKGIVLKAGQNIFLDKREGLNFANKNNIFVMAK